ncbi:hypothetical protein EMPG_17272 [Blastomyces silverae]|uniref:Uncharacterized protein n=1 Tax=Blastomyces silverae TaxID=2060906 RepID=A0A0H1BDB9_9EURO|nr:hypothetical protein EMPG_17272 [Blastomyces silverae]
MKPLRGSFDRALWGSNLRAELAERESRSGKNLNSTSRPGPTHLTKIPPDFEQTSQDSTLIQPGAQNQPVATRSSPFGTTHGSTVMGCNQQLPMRCLALTIPVFVRHTQWGSGEIQNYPTPDACLV